MWQRDSPTCGREKPTNRFVTPIFGSGLGSRFSSTVAACCDSFCLKDFGSFRSPLAADFFSGFGFLSQQTRPLVAERNPHISFCLPDTRARNGQVTRFTSRTTPAYFGRYIRASITSSRFLHGMSYGCRLRRLCCDCRSLIISILPPGFRHPLIFVLHSWSRHISTRSAWAT